MAPYPFQGFISREGESGEKIRAQNRFQNTSITSVNSIYIREIPSRGVCPWIMPVGCARYLYVAGLCQIYTVHVPLGMCHGHYVIEHISWVSHVGYVSGASIYWKYPPDKKYPGIYLGGFAVDIIPGNLLLDKSPGQLNSGRMMRAIMI